MSDPLTRSASNGAAFEGFYRVSDHTPPANFASNAGMAASPLLAIIGPTASGKSALALEVARRVNAELLSVDSMQVYRRLNIGTAKPSAAEQSTVRHHLIDLTDPMEGFTVAQFVEMADAVLSDARHRKMPVVAVGGTPLYFKALFVGLFEGPHTNQQIRDRLRACDHEALHKRLTEVDPEAAARIHVNDERRLVRALEVFELTGRPISSFQTEWAAQQIRHPATWIGLSWEKETINKRINARVRAMMDAGWLDEVRSLVERFGSLSPTAAEATGYRELLEHLAGRMSLSDTVELIKIATRQLARRQMKWFRRFSNVAWLQGDQPVEKLAKQVVEIWHDRASSEPSS